jgi:hypothetical protein
MANKNKWVHIKTTEQERADWHVQAQLAKLTLADLIRKSLNTTTVDRAPIRRRAARKADPQLLIHLARVGNNLNQLARWANTYKSETDAVQVLAALAAIEHRLRVDHPGASDAG